MLIFADPLAVTRAEFKLKGEAVILTLASAVSVTKPDPIVNGSHDIITLAASPVAVGVPTDKVNALALTLIVTLPSLPEAANGNADIASNPKLINNP